MNLYVVDYENVSDQGLMGVDSLSSTDCVIVYFGPLNRSISIDMHILLQRSKAHFRYIQTKKVAKNYLDFYITASLSSILARKHYEQVFIISKDRGYDSVVDFWSEQGVIISQKPAITL